MEAIKGYNYLQLSGGDLGDKLVYVGVPNVGLTQTLGMFHKHGLADVEMLPIPTPKPPVPFEVPLMYNPWANTKVVYYEDANCQRCANRYRRNEWCDNHHRQTSNCYRFKLEKQ